MSNAARATGGGRPARLSALRRSGVARPALVTLELVTGATGLVGGVLLAAVPDGSLLRADPATLSGSPFGDWRVPGVLLGGLVGGGFLVAGWWQWRGRQRARELSMIAGAGLVCFEAAELGWLGFQPLEAVFALVGATTVILAWHLPPGIKQQAGRNGVHAGPALTAARAGGTAPRARSGPRPGS
jgi:hypothetical protein